jgi:AhpD family alkylhydroperoxidase
MNDYIATAKAVSAGAMALRKAHPKAMEAFAALGSATYGEGALDAKTKELIALAIGITVRCDGCVAAHGRSAWQKGVTREELAEAIGVAIHMGGGPSMVYGAEALRAYDAFVEEAENKAKPAE